MPRAAVREMFRTLWASVILMLDRELDRYGWLPRIRFSIISWFADFDAYDISVALQFCASEEG